MEDRKNGAKLKIKKKTAVKILIVLLLILVILLVGIFMVPVNFNKTEIEETDTKAMNEKKEYMKSIQLVEEDNEYVHMEEDANGDRVPVPNGYIGSNLEGENEIDTGYVIYEGTDPINVDDEDEIKEAQKTRNQYVWVPVPDPNELYEVDADGILWSKLYKFDVKEGDEETGTLPLPYTYQYLEPYIVEAYDTMPYFKEYGVKVESTSEFLINMQREFEMSMESVTKYGGFYIGRYETGGWSSTPNIVKINKDLYASWYEQYEKCKELRGSNKNVITGMISGAMFDRTLIWLIQSGAKTKEEVAEDSSSWGNCRDFVNHDYEDEYGRIKKTDGIYLIPTGSCEDTKANNIYDIAGNAMENTLEVYTYYGRGDRGGGISWDDIAGFRNMSVPTEEGNTCRAVLIMK